MINRHRGKRVEDGGEEEEEKHTELTPTKYRVSVAAAVLYSIVLLSCLPLSPSQKCVCDKKSSTNHNQHIRFSLVCKIIATTFFFSCCCWCRCRCCCFWSLLLFVWCLIQFVLLVKISHERYCCVSLWCANDKLIFHFLQFRIIFSSSSSFLGMCILTDLVCLCDYSLSFVLLSNTQSLFHRHTHTHTRFPIRFACCFFSLVQFVQLLLILIPINIISISFHPISIAKKLGCVHIVTHCSFGVNIKFMLMNSHALKHTPTWIASDCDQFEIYKEWQEIVCQPKRK